MEKVRLFLVISSVYYNYCSGVSLRRQLEHIARTRAESQGLNEEFQSRRFYQFDPREISGIVGIPSMPNHLPEAEPVLPGHTLIRPSLGMLKSAVKFPHKELEDGAGVYGNIDNLGIRYDSKNERVLYSGFRRTPSDYIMVMPTKGQDKRAKFKIASTVLDLVSLQRYRLQIHPNRRDHHTSPRARLADINDKKDLRNKLMKALSKQNVLHKGNIKIIIASLNKNRMDTKESLEDKMSYNSKLISKDKSWQWDTLKQNERFDGKLKRFVPVHSEYLYNLRDTNGISDMKTVLRNKKILNPPVQSSSVITSKERGMLGGNVEADETTKKSNWLTAQKNFDHIQVNDNAPEYNDLIPKDLNEKLRQWWFYNQQDFKELSGERR